MIFFQNIEILIQELFEIQAKVAPNSLAVVHEGRKLTYRELNSRANRLAHRLRQEGVGPDVLVAISTERSLDMVVGVLGILKAGGAYVPVDPGYPQDRIAYMLSDSAPRVLLTQKHLRQGLPEVAARVLLLDEEETYENQPAGNPSRDETGATSGNLAYVIYTSGSTGLPKGVMIEHASVCNLAQAQRDALAIDGNSRILQFASMSFDACVWEMVMALLNGAQLHLASREALMPGRGLFNLLEEKQISHVTLPPTALGVMSKQIGADKIDGLTYLQTLVVAGEACPPSLAVQWGRNRRFVNAYGPTEATVCATMQVFENGVDEGLRSLPIGKPIANGNIYILDGEGCPVSIGEAGEIHIGGAGVARGYLNRPELTEERLVPDPFVGKPGARMYRTGDLGRWREDGTIEYLGRNDDQVKIRGFRIEPGEIETWLLDLPGVHEAVVITREDAPGDRRLVAYWTANENVGEPSLKQLRDHLQAELPAYMVPSAFVRLDTMPLTPNGKIDKKALPRPGLDAFIVEDYEAPQGETEESVAAIWKELLGLERVGRNDNFFDLGGNSLLAAVLVETLWESGFISDVHQVFGSRTLSELAGSLSKSDEAQWEAPPQLIPDDCSRITPDMLPLVSLEQHEIDSIVDRIPDGSRNVQDIYPLVPLQEGMLFHHRFDSGNDPYVLWALVVFETRERFEELRRALNELIARHDILRTAIVWEGLRQPVQVVRRFAELKAVEHESGEEDPTAYLRSYRDGLGSRMDLEKAPLLAIDLAQRHGDRHVHGLFRIHHTIVDHVAMDVLFEELAEILNGRPASLLPDTVPYRNFIAHMGRSDISAAEEYFRRVLGDVDEPTLPFGSIKTRDNDGDVKETRLVLDDALVHRIRAVARHHSTGPAIVFHVAFGLLIAKCSGKDDVVFGTVLSGRMNGVPGISRMQGVFINTLPMRLDLRGADVLQAVSIAQDMMLGLLKHEQTPLAVAQRCSGVDGEASLFGGVLNFAYTKPMDQSVPSGVDVIEAHEQTSYPLAVTVDDMGETFAFTVQVREPLSPGRIASYFREATVQIVNALEGDSKQKVLDLSILSSIEREQVLQGFNATQAEYPREALIHELFEAQVQKTPDAVAVVYEEEQLTYAELNTKANQLGHWLQAQGVEHGHCVPIIAPRGVEMVVGQLAVLKAGATYVPIDPEFPDERRAFMVQDCGASVVLVVDQAGVFPDEGLRWLDMRHQVAEIAGQSQENLPRVARTTEEEAPAAYVMYTSGSTGVPKGVVVPHRAVNRLVINSGYVEITAEDAIGHCSNSAFDASTFEIWAALLHGARVVIVPHEQLLDAKRFEVILEQYCVSVLFMTTALFHQYAGVVNQGFGRLRYLLVGGEVTDPAWMHRVLRENAPQNFLAVYGPTETTTFATAYRLNGALEPDARRVPIGGPIANTSVYILDERGDPVPLGVAGELYIGGEGVARGYLNRSQLTEERFVSDPFIDKAGARMYRTGDLGYWREDGAIEFLGRNDDQVKIRGLRIELGEIEARLAELPGVREVVVLAREDVPGDKRLVAYWTQTDEERAPEVGMLREHLKEELPGYMVPAAFVRLDAMPLTPNGKVDRKALPVPDASAFEAREYEAPLGQTEEVLAGIWQELLGVERVGRHDSFFDLGGHSLLLTSLSSRIVDLFNVEIPFEDLFMASSLYELSILVDEERLSKFNTEDIEIIEQDLMSLSEEDLRRILDKE